MGNAKKIGIYNPYFSIMGGAERYVLSIAQALQSDFQIVLYGAPENIIDLAHKKFGISLTAVITKPWITDRNQRSIELNDLVAFFYITDGSIFFSPAEKDFLIIQSPQHIPQLGLLNRFKLSSWKNIICYSEFVAKIIQKQIHRTSEVVFVPVDDPKINNSTLKESLIISVGRFFSHLHNKKQKEMVIAFGELLKKYPHEIKLILIGSVDPGEEPYFNEVTKLAQELPIEIITSASYEQLCHYYSQAKIYWHAAGFGEDLEQYPERAEHFGVSTLEAMSYGAIPIVYAGGGQVEIVQDGESGYLWKTENELLDKTISTLMNEDLSNALSLSAINRSKEYSFALFKQKIYDLLKK